MVIELITSCFFVLQIMWGGEGRFEGGWLERP